jgi:ribosomal-protein-alanine N-acetyltransferase
MTATDGIRVRRARDSDLTRIEEIEHLCFPSHPWDRHLLAKYECLVAVSGTQVAGFLSFRTLVRPGEEARGEFEILNLAVDPEWRRKGVAKALLDHQLAHGGVHFLEVRESNRVARKLYENMGFEVIGTRQNYYSNPEESAIVMRWKWC